MKTRFAFLAIATVILSLSATQAAPRIKVIKLSVTNPTAETRAAENIVVSIAELKRIAPDFKPAAVIVTTSNASTIDEDTNTPQTIELPSQADDLDGDLKARLQRLRPAATGSPPK